MVAVSGVAVRVAVVRVAWDGVPAIKVELAARSRRPRVQRELEIHRVVLPLAPAPEMARVATPETARS